MNSQPIIWNQDLLPSGDIQISSPNITGYIILKYNSDLLGLKNDILNGNKVANNQNYFK